jgi:hypothetical protein
MTRPPGRHTCHAKNCNKAVPPKMFMCRRHWFMLPKPMRDAVWREYNPGQEQGDAPVTGDYCKVTDEAIKWLFEQESKQGELF